jgi:Domain of unknown function (DUF4062)
VEQTRYQVFVSSTFLDLKEERAAVVSALLQLEAFPAGMELFPATDDDAWTLITRVIDSSDYYLLVIGGKYGSIDPGTELSFTEKEYDYAVEQGKPVMAFLHANPDKIEFGKSEKDKNAQEKLKAFRERVERQKHVKYWSGPENLAGEVALSFANFRQTYPAVGWVRGDLGTSAEALQEINELRKQLTAAERERVRSGPPDEAKGFAQGDDAIGFRFVIKARAKGMPSGKTFTFKRFRDFDVSWNDVFSRLGPEMLNEADEPSLRERIKTWLDEEHGIAIRKSLRKATFKDGDKVERLLSSDIDISDEDFGTLIIQMRALGLIEKSERQRSVKDKGTYWSLTAYGDEHLTTLRAIRRNGSAKASKVPTSPDPSETKATTAKKKSPKKRAPAKKAAGASKKSKAPKRRRSKDS